MTDDHNQSAFSSGFALLCRRQCALWWIFAVNFACGLLGALPGFMAVRRGMGHSLAAHELTHRFDIGMFVELLRLPDVHLTSFTSASYVFVFLFFVFMLFVTGGVLETYREDRRLSAGEFFAASGAYFWPFVRLMLLSIAPFAIVGMIYQGLDKIADRVGDQAIADQVGIFMGWGAMAIFLLLALGVRLWFDIAQVRAVAQHEHRMWRNLWRSWRITWQGVGGLYGMYFVISLLAWITICLGLWIWTMLPATATGAVFLVFQLIVFLQIASRLWQLAAAMTWYKRHAEMLPVPLVPYPTPMPHDGVSAEPSPTLADIVAQKTAGDFGAANPAGTSPAGAQSDPAPPRDSDPELPPPGSHLK